MKRLFCAFGIIAASVASFTSCNKETPVDGPANNLVTVSFYAEKPGTKTAAVEGDSSVSYIWTEEDIDNIKLFTVSEDGSIESEVTSAVATKVSDNKMTISAKVDANNTYTFRAILCDPASYAGTGDYANQNPAIKDKQTPGGNKSFDPTADILVSDDYTIEVGGDPIDDLLLTFRRQVVINKMTLKGLNAGEQLNEVVVKSDKFLTGYFSNGTMFGQFKEITLSYDSVTIPDSGEFDVYFVTMENTEQLLTVEVATDEYSYTKTFGKTIDFKLGYFTKFGVVLPEGQHVSDLSGYYLIACLNGNVWQLMDPNIGSSTFYPYYTSDVKIDAENVKFSDFSDIANINDYIWRIDEYSGGYSIRSTATGNYLALTSNANAAHASSSLSNNTKFFIENNGTKATIKSSAYSTRTLQYNSSTPRFAFYTSTQQPIALIPAIYDERTLVSLSFENGMVQYDTDNYEEFTGQVVSIAPNDPAISNNITWTLDDETDDIVSSFDASTGSLTLRGTTGLATVTAFFAGDATYRSTRASYQIMVTSASAPKWVKTDFENISDGAKFVLVAKTTSGEYAMGNDNGTDAPKAVSIIITGSNLASEPESNIVWTMSKADGVVRFSASADKYLYTTATNNGLHVGTNTNNVLELDSSGYLTMFDGTQKRYIGVYTTTPDWRSYTSINSNIQGQTFTFYVKQ